MSRRIRFAATLISAALVATGSAGAADNPQPDCSGIQFTDPAGDQAVSPQGLPLPADAPENLDIIAGFFTVENSKAFANLRVTNLDDATAPGADGARWYAFFSIGDVDNWVRADRIGTDVTYQYGHVDGTSLALDGDTTGKLFPGKDGVIQIALPAAFKAVGKTLTKTGGESRAITETATTLYTSDIAPDDAADAKDVTLAPCATGTTPTAPAPTAPAPSAPGPAPGPNAAAPEQLDVKVSVGSQSARRIARKRALVVSLRSVRGVKNLTGTLMSGKRKLGTGRLAALGSRGKLKIRVKRKLKRGGYTLKLVGTNSSGRRAAGVVNFRIGK